MKLSFLGTGASYSGGKRLNTSLVVEKGDSVMMVDCSGTPEYALKRCNIEISGIEDLFLTHYHIDHIYALPSLIQVKRLVSFPGGGAKLRIYGNSETLQISRKLINLFKLGEKHNAVLVDFIELEEEEGIIKLRDFRLEYFRVSHGIFPALGFLIETESMNVIYSGDSQVCSSIVNRLNKKTVLIHDCGGISSKKNHSDIYEIARELKGKKIQKLYLVHIPFLTAGEEGKMISIIKESIDFEVSIPGDGDTIFI